MQTSNAKVAVNTPRAVRRICTIGHSDHDVSRFLQLLRAGEITTVADVRSSPFSQRYPQFNQSELRQSLETSGLRYVFFGEELGGGPSDVAVYDSEGRVDYWRVRRTAYFRAGLERLLAEAEHHAVAMMCAEEDPLDCHRTLMVAAELVERGISPVHLRGSGSVETTAQLHSRLFEITGVGGGMATGLFAASLAPSERAELLTEAYQEQARRKAFRLPPGHDIADIDTAPEFPSE